MLVVIANAKDGPHTLAADLVIHRTLDLATGNPCKPSDNVHQLDIKKLSRFGRRGKRLST